MVEFSITNIDPTKGTIATSKKEKFGQMKDWAESSFHEYQYNKHSSHFVIAKKHKKINCTTAGCSYWVNKNCGHKMCKKCCMKLQAESGKLSVCKIKEHQLTEPAPRMCDDTEWEGSGQEEGDGNAS